MNDHPKNLDLPSESEFSELIAKLKAEPDIDLDEFHRDPVTGKVSHYTLDAAGDPVPAESFTQWLEWTAEHSKDERTWTEFHRIGLDHIGDDIEVSTVFLGRDNRFFGDGPPLLYETMIFGGAYDRDRDRYATRAEAVIGHRLAVKRIKETLAS